jgi:site-specific DNA-methyltransferase (adenine-specific)
MQRIDDGSVDVILTDPPYLYLKNQKLDRPFDETTFFNEVKRVLKKDGFIVLFGRGTSFYRWNTMLANLGFKFKEEIVWNKIYSSSPILPLQRFHEMISIHTSGFGKIKKCTIPYLESKQYNFDSIIGDINRIKSSLNNTTELDGLIRFLKDKKKRIVKRRNDKAHGLTISPNSTGIFSIPESVLNNIIIGSRERSIMNCVHDRYTRIHPTQKPVRLLERLLALVSKEGDVVLDPFSGSASVAIAAYNTGRQYIGFEIDKEYYEASVERVNNVLISPKQKKLFTA